MEIHREAYFAISTENRPGELASVTAILMEAGVDLYGLWGYGTGHGAAQIIAIPHDEKKFMSVAKDVGWRVREGVCFHVEGQNKAGVLVDLLQKIAAEGVNLMAVDSMSLEDHFGCYMWAEDDDSETLAQLLGMRVPLA